MVVPLSGASVRLDDQAGCSVGLPYIARIRKNEVLNRMAKPLDPTGGAIPGCTAEALVP